jgi:hypothetical protein
MATRLTEEQKVELETFFQDRINRVFFLTAAQERLGPDRYPSVTIDSLFQEHPYYIVVNNAPVKIFKFIGTEREPSILNSNTKAEQDDKRKGFDLKRLLGEKDSLAKDAEDNWYRYKQQELYGTVEEATEAAIKAAAKQQKLANAKAEYAGYNAAQYPNRKRVPFSKIVTRIHNGGRRTRKHKHKRKTKRTFKKARK